MRAVVAALLVAGCASVSADERLQARRLAVLERDFAAFVARPLDREESVDDATAELERLRIDYLDALEQAPDDEARVLALVRIAELHLDLGARIRRIPYPPLSSPAAQRAFDEKLSQRALPLEAIGLGVLQQADETAARGDVDDRFSTRARLYLALHGDRRDLSRDELLALQRELRTRGPFSAPRTLLEAGRIGMRAARR